MGFSFWATKGGKWKPKPHLKSYQKLIRKLKQLTDRSWSISLDNRIKKINYLVRGWINYFRIANMKNRITEIDKHLRTRIRMIIWKQWKVPKKRLWGLKKLGVENWIAHKVAYWGDCYQKVATKSIVTRAISKEILIKRGLISISDYYQRVAHI